MADRLSLQEAADRLGVHYMTAYRWVRDGRLPATKLGGRFEVRVEDVEALVPTRPAESPVAAADRQRREANVDRLAGLLVDGDAAEVRSQLDALAAEGLTPSELADTVVTPALRRISDMWELGATDGPTAARAATVASSGLSRLTVGGPARDPRRGAAATLVLPAGGEEAGTAALAGDLREAGWEVHHLGRDMAIPDVAVFVDIVPVDVVCVVVDAPLPPEDYEALADACRGRQLVLIGEAADLVLAEPLGLAVLAGVGEVADHLSRVAADRTGPISP